MLHGPEGCAGVSLNIYTRQHYDEQHAMEDAVIKGFGEQASDWLMHHKEQHNSAKRASSVQSNAQTRLFTRFKTMQNP